MWCFFFFFIATLNTSCLELFVECNHFSFCFQVQNIVTQCASHHITLSFFFKFLNVVDWFFSAWRNAARTRTAEFTKHRPTDGWATRTPGVCLCGAMFRNKFVTTLKLETNLCRHFNSKQIDSRTTGSRAFRESTGFRRSHGLRKLSVVGR